MTWTEVQTKKKAQMVQCRLEGPLSHGGSSDGSIYSEISLNGDRVACVTVTYLPVKLAEIGKKITLVHPDSKKEQEWTIVSRGVKRWVNEKGEILWGA